MIFLAFSFFSYPSSCCLLVPSPYGFCLDVSSPSCHVVFFSAFAVLHFPVLSHSAPSDRLSPPPSTRQPSPHRCTVLFFLSPIAALSEYGLFRATFFSVSFALSLYRAAPLTSSNDVAISSMYDLLSEQKH